MQPKNPKKNESVKAGLQIEGHHIPETQEELSDLLHGRRDKQTEVSKEDDSDEKEKDPDDLVHQKKSIK